MDKKTFISELEQALSVLQEEELQDIMEEYEQHIDMKVQNGLTEEEAIADFGNLKDLTSEILEAYHVRGDYASVREETGKSRFSSIRAGKANPGEGVKRGPDIRKAGADFRNFCVSQGKKQEPASGTFQERKREIRTEERKSRRMKTSVWKMRPALEAFLQDGVRRAFGGLFAGASDR